MSLVRQDIFPEFDLNENDKKTEEINSVVILVCKFFDNIHGHHFAVVFGNDFKKNSDLINKVLNRSFIRTTRRLLQVLKEKNHKKAMHKFALLSTILIQ